MIQTIYKLDSKEKLRFLTIYAEGDEVVQISGLVGSENPVTNRSRCIGKNIGKSNGTTPENQAISEAQSKLTKKLREGYYATKEEAENGVLILPMLAKDFNEEEKKVKYPCFAQPKLDGMRALKERQKLTSRKNKEIDTMNHISVEMMDEEYIFDGELYAHGKSFQKNMELIKKFRKGESEEVKYHVYDLVMPHLPFEERLITLRDIIFRKNPQHFVEVPTYQIESKEELLTLHAKFLEEGYEGTIVRHGEKGYESNKRSSSLLKFKDFKDLACKIVGVEASEKRPDHGSFICEMEDGGSFGCGMRFSHEERKDVMLNPQNYIGKTAEIRFFEYTDEGKPRFPVCVGLRLDK